MTRLIVKARIIAGFIVSFLFLALEFITLKAHLLKAQTLKTKLLKTKRLKPTLPRTGWRWLQCLLHPIRALRTFLAACLAK